MKRIVALLFIVCAFCTINVMASSQVITSGKIENPGSQHGGGQRGPVELPEVFQEGHTFVADASCYGLTLRIVQGDSVVFETIVSEDDGGEVVVPEYITGYYELQVLDGYYIYYGYVML